MWAAAEAVGSGGEGGRLGVAGSAMDDDCAKQSDDPGGRGGTRGARGPVRLDVVDHRGLLTAQERSRLEGWGVAAVGAAGAAGDVRVKIVTDREMTAAHLRYSGVESTTDVLTFDMRESGEGALDVDLWLCVDEARRQAGERGIELERELLLYCLHGVLHCLGYDDHDGGSYARMHAEEDRVLEAIGVGRTFDAGRVVAGGEGA